MEHQEDLVILGGGLAGLTLAMQLKQNAPDMAITVLEMRKNIAPDSAHKVGESTVELGTYYLREVLGLKDYLDEFQLPKQGLRFYFSPHIKEQLDQRVELGPKGTLPIPSHQIDRGIFENELIKRIRELGVEVLLGARIKNVDFGKDSHLTTFLRDKQTYQLKSTWVVDATGRAAFLKRKEGFEKALDHNVNAVWFRVKGEIDVDDWSDNEQWRNKLSPGLRRLGTIHFMGKGYWVWLIPLVSGNTSVGIVSDPRFHDFEDINKFDKAMQWLAINEPLCARKLKEYSEDLMDFRVLKHCAHDSGRFYSTHKWGVIGEAAAFLDPFYSPGTDFISIGNAWMSDLILRDFRGEDVASRSILYERVYMTFFQSWIPIYQNQYELFGNTQVMVAKILWDWGVYWAIPTLLFTNNGYTNKEVLRALFTSKNSVGSRLGAVNKQMQNFFLDWGKAENEPYINDYIDFFDIPFLKKLHQEVDVIHSTEYLVALCKTNMRILEEMAAEIFRKVSANLKGTPENMKINPYEMDLNLSMEELMEQAEGNLAIHTSEAIASDLELMWLKEKSIVE